MPDLSAPPPARYRVVESERRLVVIDRWADGGRPGPVSPTAAAPGPDWLSGVRQTRFDGGGELTTHPLYDDNGPRTIRLDPNSAMLTKAARYALLITTAVVLVAVVLSPWLVVPAGFIAFKSRRGVRSAITGWLDTVAREAS